MRDIVGLIICVVIGAVIVNVSFFILDRNEMKKLPQKEVILAYKDKNDINLYLQVFMPSEAGLTCENRVLKLRYKSYCKELANGVYSYKILRIKESD